MVKFDVESGNFLLEKELSPSQIQTLSSARWTHRFGINRQFTTEAVLEAREYAAHYKLSQMDFNGKTVLCLGGGDGFSALYALSNGAKKVSVLSFGTDISTIEALNSILEVGIEIIELHPYEVRGEFDCGIVIGELHHLTHPLLAIEKFSGAIREEMLLVAHVIDSEDPFPWAVLYPDNRADNYEGATCGPNQPWIRTALQMYGFKPELEHLWSTQHISKRLTVRAKKNPIQKKTLAGWNPLPDDNGSEKNTAVVVLSCKRFEQVWRPFFTLFKKYWPDCPYQMYLGTDTGTYGDITTIQTGKDFGWPGNAIRILSQLKEDRILLFQEDFLIQKPVQTDRLRKLVRHSYDFDIGCLRLMPIPGPSRTWFASDLLGAISASDPYRLSLQLAVWKRSLILELLNENETPWQTEENGTTRAALRPEPFLSIKNSVENPLDYYVTGVVQGAWEDGALELLRREGISLEGITKIIPRSS